MSQTTITPLHRIADKLLKYTGIGLVATVWTSAAIFGLYIVAFYAFALFGDDIDRWNRVLPGLYDPKEALATAGIGIHFAAGGIILMLGCIQLMEGIRKRYPKLHRWLGKIYILASIFAGLGGLTFIFTKGTVGGTIMDIGFSLYGMLMLLAAFETYRHARAKRFDQHRAWAIRLFALAIGSWLYRMDYGFWFLFTDGLWHTDNFGGGFDKLMSFFFYLPNLIVAEVFIGKRTIFRSSAAKIMASIALILATAFLVLATFFFTTHLWGRAIIELIAGS